MVGRLKEGFLQGFKYEREKRVWLTRIDEFKKKKGRKGTFEEARTKILDGEGLYLILTVAGGMSWRIEYTFQGVRKSYSPGQYRQKGDGVSLAKAREVHRQVRAWITDGKDPSAIKREEKGSIQEAPKEKDILTFEKIAREWFEQKTLERAPKYREQIRSRIEKKLLPAVGKIPIAELKGADILPVMRKNEENGEVEAAHKVAYVASQICQYAVILGYIDHDPCAKLGKALRPRESKNSAALTDTREIGLLLKALDDYTGFPSVKYGLKIMAYVFLRSLELRAATWQEIDLENATWTVPAERMKKKREHIIPLAKQVVQLFLELKKITGYSKHCFPSPYNSSKPVSDMALLNGIRRMGYGKDEM